MKMKFNWEIIADNNSEQTARAKVIGGWVLGRSVTEYLGDAGSVSEALVFIPDPKHEWEV